MSPMNKTVRAARSPRAWPPAGPARRGRLAAAVTIAVAAVAGAAVLAAGALAGHGQRGPVTGAAGVARRPAPRTAPQSGTAPAPSAPVSNAPAAPGPAVIPARGTLQLVTGSHLVNGIYTDYPRNLAGAVSLAVEVVAELGSTLEPDRAATIARLTASPSYPAAAPDAAAGAIAARHAVGLSPAAAVPPGTAVLTVPVMYQLSDVSRKRLTVLLLFDYTQITRTGITDHTGVTAVRLGWTPGSWRLLPPAAGPGPASAAMVATPGTAAATAHGWKAMTDAL
jgi:hypothetical protein